jgi:hypothetical protein
MKRMSHMRSAALLFSPGAPAPATAADHSGRAFRGCPALRITAGHCGTDSFSGRHHPWQRRNPQRLRVTLRRPGLQGKNPGKKERS